MDGHTDHQDPVIAVAHGMRPGDCRAIRKSTAGVVGGNYRIVDHGQDGVGAIDRAPGILDGRKVSPRIVRLRIGDGVRVVGGSRNWGSLKIPLIAEGGSAGSVHIKRSLASDLGSLIHRLDSDDRRRAGDETACGEQAE